jgi:hypothetical protein
MTIVSFKFLRCLISFSCQAGAHSGRGGRSPDLPEPGKQRPIGRIAPHIEDHRRLQRIYPATREAAYHSRLQKAPQIHGLSCLVLALQLEYGLENVSGTLVVGHVVDAPSKYYSGELRQAMM